jgi:hypothetical protein
LLFESSGLPGKRVDRFRIQARAKVNYRNYEHMEDPSPTEEDARDLGGRVSVTSPAVVLRVTPTVRRR